jgi:hypothetical protein
MTETGARTQPTRPAHCRVTVAGPLSTAATRALRSQYGRALSIDRVDHESVLQLDGLDQPAIRGLLTLLWDLGHEVVTVTNQSTERPS